MTEKEKTALIVGETGLSTQIERAINHLKFKGVSLAYLTEVLAEITDELIAKEFEDKNATS